MMDWKKLLTPQRLGKTKPEEDIKPGRTPFHRDYLVEFPWDKDNLIKLTIDD